MTIQRIVFGDDHSTGADTAWGWLNAQDWAGWPVRLVTGCVTADVSPTTAKHRHALPDAGLVPIEVIERQRDPRLLLLEEGQDSLLVIGARGVGGFEELVVGSTADWLMRSPPAPMVIARQAAPVRTALVCVDGSHHADAAVRAFASLPWASQVACTVLGVADSSEPPTDTCAEAAQVLRSVGAPVTVVVEDLDDMVATLNPAHRIVEYITTHEPDLVVMGTQGRTGLARLWFGSVAGAVAHQTRSNVLLARAE